LKRRGKGGGRGRGFFFAVHGFDWPRWGGKGKIYSYLAASQRLERKKKKKKGADP